MALLYRKKRAAPTATMATFPDGRVASPVLLVLLAGAVVEAVMLLGLVVLLPSPGQSSDETLTLVYGLGSA